MGRKRTPTALAALHGNPSKIRLPDAEPVPTGALEEPPEWLTREQAESWRYALAHAPPGLLRRLDRGMLTIWVVAEATHQRAVRLLEKRCGSDLMTTQGEQEIPSMYLSVINKQALLMIKVASELGFSPSARARVYAQPSGGSVTRTTGGRVVSLAQYVANAPPRPA
jgi:phage terminase small subunit